MVFDVINNREDRRKGLDKTNDGHKFAYKTAMRAIRIAEHKDSHGGCLVYIYGKPGTGKTRLLEYLFDNTDLKTAFLGAGVLDVIERDHLNVELELIEDVNLLSDDPEENDMFKEAILQTGVDEDFSSKEKNLVLIMTSDSPPEKAFKDDELIRLIRKGLIVKITR